MAIKPSRRDFGPSGPSDSASERERGYPGQAGGLALAQLLVGEASPSGRLSQTFYRALGFALGASNIVFFFFLGWGV